jgi:hypothetical protein
VSGKVGLLVTTVAGGALDRLELVLEDRLGVVEQPTDEGRLAVVNAAGGGKPKQFHA